MAAMSRANARQSNKHKVYYQRQYDVTPVNKAIKMARHWIRFRDKSVMSKLKALPPLILKAAINKMPKESHIHMKLRALST